MEVRFFWDMDGSLAEWKTTTAFEDLYEKGYFAELKAHENLIEASKLLPRIIDAENYINSHYLSDSKYALTEKNEWVDAHMPHIGKHNRIFSSCGTDKSVHVPGKLCATDFLIDDYTPNLYAWEGAGGTGIKYMNGINGTKGTWNGYRVFKEDSVETVVKTIMKAVKEKQNSLLLKIEEGEVER